jgi:hypothetical protein
METDKKLKQQTEWLATFTLTQDKFKELIAKKLMRNAQLQCKKKSYTNKALPC